MTITFYLHAPILLYVYKALNVRSKLLNVRSEALNVRSKALNIENE